MARVIGTKKTKNSSVYELHAHIEGSPNEYHSIVQTFDRGVSTKNQFGGHSGQIRVGTPKYIRGLWNAFRNA